MNKTIYYLLFLPLLTTGCESKQEIEDCTPLKNHGFSNHRISSRSATSDSSPYDFGAKIFDFEETHWIHSGYDSYQLIPLQTEYDAIAAIVDEPQIYNCVQFRLNIYRRGYERQYSFNVTLISKNENSFDSYVSNNLFCKDASSSSVFSGYEIFTNPLTNNVVAANFYENGILSQGASLYSNAQSLEDNKDDIKDILYGIGIHKEINTDFDYSKSTPEIDFYQDIIHNSCSFSVGSYDDNLEVNFNCGWDWIESIEDDDQDHEGSSDGGGGSVIIGDGHPYIPPVISSYNWIHSSTDKMCKSVWFNKSNYSLFAPSIYDILSYLGLYFNFNNPPEYYFEKAANRMIPIQVYDTSITDNDLEDLLSLFYTYTVSESIAESIDNGYPCILNASIDTQGKCSYLLCIGYTDAEKAIYFNPYLNRLEARDIETLDCGSLYSITELKN